MAASAASAICKERLKQFKEDDKGMGGNVGRVKTVQ